MFKKIISIFLFLGFSSASIAGGSASLYSPEQLSQSLKTCSHLFPKENYETFIQSFGKDFEISGLCSDDFAVIYSKKTKTPLVVVEKLNAHKVKEMGETRDDNFFPDPRLKFKDSAQLSDYKHSGYDRGHMFPAANSTTPNSMAQSFSLSNIIPQNSKLNRGSWAKLESDTRKYASRAKGDVYVVTGVLFNDKKQKTIGNGVYIPSHIYKYVSDTENGKNWVYLAENNDDGKPFPPTNINKLKELGKQSSVGFVSMGFVK